MNVYRVQKHISRVMPLWQEFQRKNRGFEQVRFYSYTDGGGMFSAIGEVATDADRAKLRAFMESTNPPRPVYLGGLRVLELEEKIKAEQDAAANGSQPFSSETNRTSSAAGSRR
jgi:hypothetical protein